MYILVAMREKMDWGRWWLAFKKFIKQVKKKEEKKKETTIAIRLVLVTYEEEEIYNH